ncbi:Uncharacterised protein [Mycobacterium tuberculosis]|nr:Uncharacterised protein [Mycobacterium tuberculosis]
MPHRFLDRRHREFGALAQHRPLLGVIEQYLYGSGELIAGGVRSGQQQAGHGHTKLVGAEPVAIILGTDEIRE